MINKNKLNNWIFRKEFNLFVFYWEWKDGFNVNKVMLDFDNIKIWCYCYLKKKLVMCYVNLERD